MKRKPLLSLAAEVDYALGIKLKGQNVFLIGLEISLLKGMKRSIKEEEILVLRVIWHHNQKRNNSIEHIVELLV